MAAEARFRATGKLREVRMLRGLTQQMLADMAGLSAPFVSHIERDVKGVRPRAANALAAALDLTLEQAVKNGLFILQTGIK